MFAKVLNMSLRTVSLALIMFSSLIKSFSINFEPAFSLLGLDVVLVFLLFSLSIFTPFSSVSIAEIGQVNVSLEGPKF